MTAIGPEPKEIDYEAAFRDIESHPLFMRDLPDDPGSNDQLEALKSLIYDGEPDGEYPGGFTMRLRTVLRSKD